MSANKFKFPIFPDRMYTLTYDELSTEISGEEILAVFRRSVMLEHLLQELADDTDSDNAIHWEFPLDNPDDDQSYTNQT